MVTFFKVKEAAKQYKVGRNLLYNAIKNKEIVAYKPNCRDFLLKSTDIEKWIETKVV